MAPAEVANIYHELRRMSRLWCWMKCLKWAGYGSTTKNVSDVSAGQLTIFCPACPQPGINIPDNWIDDPSRQVVKCWLIGHDLFYYTAGYTNIYLWLMEISRPTMYDKIVQQGMYGCLKVPA